MCNLSLRIGSAFAVVIGMIGALVAAAPARAQDCPGNPNALGTSRVLLLEPGEPTRVGIMQYHDSLPLSDKEVVLTFDDGPLPPYTNQILDILAAQCVRATFFLVGRMAHDFPAAARRVYEAGHTIGTHSEDHPFRFGNLSIEKLRREIDRGIADVGAALGDPSELAPFFRIPGLARSDLAERELAARSLVVFSSDAVADDWHRRIKPGEIIARAMSRLEKRGKGILLLHDIHPVTVAALPGLLKALKEEGFHVVHVVPAERPGRIETADQGWPAAPAETPTDRVALPLPEFTTFDAGYLPEQAIMLAGGSEGAALVAGAGLQWPDPSNADPPSHEAVLPAPSIQDLGILRGELRADGEALALQSSVAAAALTETGPAPSRN
jgi:peptidoglycan-N-acetylglucosamine deacetylase